MTRAAHPQPTHSARAEQAGFTLVELMVAMTGGLFLSIVVFALSRDATRFYQSESRAANATLAGVTGFERLSNDIARAGHLVTPNIESDPRVCNRPDATWPGMIRSLRAITVDTSDELADETEVKQAGLTPMSIVLAGALDVSEELSVNHVGPNAAGGFTVTIRPDSPAAARLGIRVGAANVANNLRVLQSMFQPGGIPANSRAVRITQLDGMEQYGLVTGVVSDPLLQVTLAGAPALLFRSNAADAVQCGFRGFSTGSTINVVNFIRYELRAMAGESGSAYASLFAASRSAGLPYEERRVELIREELTPAGASIAESLEIIAEYAVDLQFSALQATSALDPTLLVPAPGTITAAFGSTQLLRGLTARLSVRSREADRAADVAGMPAGDLYRIGLGSGGTAPFARVRTFQAHIPLRNLEGANW
jgi:hypothetical protein